MGWSQTSTYYTGNTTDPMKRKTVSLCLIARNEEATIGMAIKSVLALVDEVIVVDTGSDDNTRIIAEGYGARVLDVAWEDDFAAARNAALAEADCTQEQADAIFKLSALSSFEDRFVVPPFQREMAIEMLEDPHEHRSSAGFGSRLAPKRS